MHLLPGCFWSLGQSGFVCLVLSLPLCSRKSAAETVPARSGSVGLLQKDTAALPPCNAAASPLQCSAQSSRLGCHAQHFWARQVPWALHQQDCSPTHFASLPQPPPAQLMQFYQTWRSLVWQPRARLSLLVGEGCTAEIQGEQHCLCTAPATPCALPSLNNFAIFHLMSFFLCAASAGSLAPSKSAALIPLMSVPLD